MPGEASDYVNRCSVKQSLVKLESLIYKVNIKPIIK